MSAVADGSVIIEAILDTADVSKNVRNLGKELNGVSWKNIKEGDEKAQALSSAFKSAGTACTMSLTAPVAAAGAVAFGVASDYQQATSQIQAAFGVTREEAERFKDIGADVYENGWGQSMEDVTQAIITVKENFRDLDGAELQNVTESALMLRDTFDMDVSESIRGAENMATAFGISAEQSMDLLTVAAQNGLNSTDELGDNLAEYATLFQENGYSASEMFSVLQAGLDAGAYNLDKVNDLVKEFGVRMSDGSVATACEELGGNFKTIYDEAQAAGKSNKETFSLLASEIKNCGSEQEKAAAISAIFGSQGEDNGIKVIEAMAGVTDSYADVAGAAKEAGDAASDNFATKWETATRKVLGSLEPLGDPLLNIAEKLAGIMQGFGEWFASIGEGGQTAVLVIAGIAAAIGPVLSIIGAIIPVVSTVIEIVGLCGGAMGVLSGVMTALLTPVTAIVAGIAAFAALLIYLWNTNEGFREAVTNAWNSIMSVIQTVMGIIGPILETGWNTIVGIVLPIVQSIANAIGTAFSTILNVVSSIMGAVSGVISGAWQVIQGIFQTVVGSIVGLVTGDFSMMSDGVSSILNGLSGIVTSIWNGIMDAVGAVVNGIGDAVTNGWNTVMDVTDSIFGGAADVIGSVMGDAENAVSGALDSIAGFFRGLHIEWPHIPLPHFEISGSFNLDPFNFSVPSIGINWYAKGGVFNGPSVIGVGEAGPEAAVPLSGSRMRPFAQEIARQMPGDTGGNITINIERFVHSGSEQDDEELLRRIAEKVRRKQRAGGIA